MHNIKCYLIRNEYYMGTFWMSQSVNVSWLGGITYPTFCTGYIIPCEEDYFNAPDMISGVLGYPIPFQVPLSKHCGRFPWPWKFWVGTQIREANQNWTQKKNYICIKRFLMPWQIKFCHKISARWTKDELQVFFKWITRWTFIF